MLSNETQKRLISEAKTKGNKWFEFTVEADNWNQLANDYYYGKNGKKLNYVYARYCYEMVLKKNNKHIYASFSLGWIYFYGQGVKNDLNEAKSSTDASSFKNLHFSSDLRIST